MPPKKRPRLTTRKTKTKVKNISNASPAVLDDVTTADNNIALPIEGIVIRGTFKQASEVFSIQSRGNQCTANAATACVCSFVRNVGTWNTAIIDTILHVGDSLYKNSRSRGTLLNLPGQNVRYLAMAELFNEITLFNEQIKFEVLENNVIAGNLDIHIDDYLPCLSVAINRFFNEYECGVLTTNGQSVAMLKAEGNYFYFDSHSRDERGSPCADGLSCVIRFCNIDLLHQKIIDNLFIRNSSNDIDNTYNLTALLVIERNPIVQLVQNRHVTNEQINVSVQSNKIIQNVIDQNNKTLLPPERDADNIGGVVSVNSHDLGTLINNCIHCGARFFQGENFYCCRNGAVQLPAPEEYPILLKQLLTGEHTFSKQFKRHIMVYNNMFAFASFAVKVHFPPGQPYSSIYIIQGLIYHAIRDIFPTENPKYGQLYFLGADESMLYRSNRLPNDGCMVLINHIESLLREVNPYAKMYMSLREVEQIERLKSLETGQSMPKILLNINDNLNLDRRRYNVPPNVGEVAIVYEGIDGDPTPARDLHVFLRNESRPTRNINLAEPSVDPLCFPLLFPRGELGWQVNIGTSSVRTYLKRKRVSRLDFITYRLLTIRDTFNPLLTAGKLSQQYIVHCYYTVDLDRLLYIRLHQNELRSHNYNGLMDYLRTAAEGNQNVGRVVILPSTYGGSPRAMQQHFQDAMAIVAKYGRPDLFITFTCDPKWPEIKRNVNKWDTVYDRVDVICRVFYQKFCSFLADLTKVQIFGKSVAYVYTIEFQKRGLPHAHLLLTLDRPSKFTDRDRIDAFVSAEIPDPDYDSELYELVKLHMIHSSCINNDTKAQCIGNDGKCTKGFPKTFTERTTLDVNSYPMYRRRNNGRTVDVKIKNVYKQADNRYVVSFSPWLLKRYKTHINVEVCSSVKSVKYIYKYIYKGHDCALIEKEVKGTLEYDEIKEFVDSRYVSSIEACWRLFTFPMHDSSHTVIRLKFHLEGSKPVYFTEGNIVDALDRASETDSMFQAWLKLNTEDDFATSFTYVQIPFHYTFNANKKQWTRRRQVANNIIPRLFTISPKYKELFYLRLLLLHVKGPKSFEDIRTVNGVVYQSFERAACAKKLTIDDKEWENCLSDATLLQMPKQMRKLFGTMLSFCKVSEPLQLWLKFKPYLIEDFIRKGYDFETAEIKALRQIASTIKYNGCEYSSFNLPILSESDNDEDHINDQENISILNDIERQLEQNKGLFNSDQSVIFEHVLRAVLSENEPDRLFYLDGPGGTGKTFLYNTLLGEMSFRKIKSVAVAWTGIAAILLSGGRTVHSRFRLPFTITRDSTSSITMDSIEAQQLRESQLIIWDEITMATVHAFNLVDRLFRDVMRNQKPFGGKVVFVGGDFRQCLPVIPRGDRTLIVESCVINATAWPSFKHFHLTQNMRAHDDQQQFTDWLLKLGNGELRVDRNMKLSENSVQIPNDFIVQNVVDAIYNNISSFNNLEESRIILCPKNDDCEFINSKIIQKLPGDSKSYFSIDSIETDDEQEQANFPIEYLNSLTPSGMPPHCLILKVGVPIMLLRNLAFSEGLCNGTRLTIKSITDHVIEAEISMGQFQGHTTFIPRMDLTSDETSLPFKLLRRQFPVKVCFAMTINKAQGQSSDHVGIYLRQPVFAHGQLYVAFSRARSWTSVKIQIERSYFQGFLTNNSFYTQNIVYHSLLSAVKHYDQSRR